MSEHTGSAKFYYVIWIALLVLTVITALVARVDLGPLNTIVALTIASFKASLVVLFFMHVKDASERLTKVVIVCSIFWLLLMLILSLADYYPRHIGA